ncbi:DUF6985 domain-containing protein [Jannaschia aquimarina]|uniref:DUF6985 domain-containing protein n=1 Tax=Jannaschia aquimarina TaxID=935700 RepID=A0A0D1CQH3_9RHOB|nr:hypothetical protein [Jannaschia aquimarina]KIT17037.1 hypothetical protein jaqu_12270 [Jannaschia aquimarina]SNS82006.1 hypothetical protein SAMN05421775_102430 [Jannaschia aquimarina]
MTHRETPVRPPIFGGVEVALLEFEPITDDGRAAFDRFMTLPPEALSTTWRHVYAYYRDYHSAVGGEDWLDAQMGVPAGPEAIWAHVRPRSITVRQDYFKTAWFVSLEADCDWEAEHGLNICWRDGTDLVKVGGYDGHVTNDDAYDDPKLANVIYAASSPEFRIYRDERAG